MSDEVKHYLDRTVSNKLLRLSQNFPCIVVTGARQVGKSTLLNHLFPSYSSVVFDPVIDIENARRDPDLFLANRKPPIILDEIQYVPELVPAIKRRIDKDRSSGQYLITGSQQWQVMKNISESLAGRAVFLNLDSFSLAELSEEKSRKSWLELWLNDPLQLTQNFHPRLKLPFTLNETLFRGFLPEARFLPLDLIADYHASYQRTYIERDIRLLADISDYQNFSRFVRLAAALCAQEINYRQLGRELGLSPQTAKRWLDLLKGTFQWHEIEPFSGNLIKRVSGKNKGYFSDAGHICYAQAISSPNALSGHPLLGAIFENAVVNEFRKRILAMDSPPQMYHWRSHGGAECDLILERDGKYYPIEIKVNSHPARRDIRGICAFRQAYPHLSVQPGLVIAPTESIFPISENDYAIPWDLA